ncbi:MAG TPA: hypothetical protein VGJ09_01465 [Bryobacteraceae bacterium]
MNLAAANLEDFAACRLDVAPPIGITSTPGTPWILMLRTPPRCWNIGKLNTRPFGSSTTVSRRRKMIPILTPNDSIH